jgi:hypothetical protein
MDAVPVPLSEKIAIPRSQRLSYATVAKKLPAEPL